MKRIESKSKYPLRLLQVFSIFFVYFAISPVSRSVWFAENFLVVVFILFLVFTYKNFKFSNLSYNLFFIFLILHSFGGYYTYSDIPFTEPLMDFFDLDRNPYDWIVHFLFGAIFCFPIYEFISREFKTRNFFALANSFLVIVAFVGLFEIFEWILFLLLGEQNGMLYLAMQGDLWDAQKDMYFAIIGAAITSFITFLTFKD